MIPGNCGSTGAIHSVLEATHQVFVVRPYFGNIGKRLVKAPKVYFTDKEARGLRGYRFMLDGEIGDSHVGPTSAK